MLGASDVTVEGQWRWVTGELFWQGNASGKVEPNMYANWGGGQPDNFNGNQDFATMFGRIPSAPGPLPGQWDDGGGGGGGGASTDIYAIDGYVIQYEGVATPQKTAITFDDTFTSPVPPEPFQGLALGYEPPNPGGNAFATQGFSFNGSTAPVTGNSGTTPELNIILDPALCPPVLGVTCISNGTHFLGTEDAFGFNRQGGGNHSIYSFEAGHAFPPGGCLTCGDPGDVLPNATGIRVVGIRGGAIVADEMFQLTSSFQKFTLTDPDWVNVVE